MLAIKLKRIGKKGQPSFRIIVGEKRSKTSGRFVDDIGWLNPITKKYAVNKELAMRWLGAGAQPTDTVYNLFIKSSLLKGKKRAVHRLSKGRKEETQHAEAQNTETQSAEVKV